jgi:hypothetical protein
MKTECGGDIDGNLSLITKDVGKFPFTIFNGHQDVCTASVKM